MLKFKLIGLAVVLKSMLVNTFNPAPDEFEANRGEYRKATFAVIKNFKESSGLETYQDSLLITHNDSGGESALFVTDLKGAIKDTLLINARNRDWEDITQDDQGNYYIGDFGNNANQRKNLVIYKYNIADRQLSEIHFHYQDQQQFPPEKQEMNYDVEAMCWHAGKLHLFTKNRGKKQVNHYALPDAPGEYSISPVESLYLPNLITGADINESGDLLALSSYGRIYLFKISATNTFFKGEYKALRFVRGAQMEGIVFVSDTDFITSNETGKLFYFSKKD
ncbi:hypothetical protein GCM10009122_45540 [Fulvivirga kasyanovii]|uniref:Uncharacterized protein n=1 Tax=Fulvivirga kasyanovii TaxID=396812 RepID=A0ABW9RRG1_9BACT|nr:hypothetical protein [Fulvivirga kasyanovii]MTI25878.1 hypothetical protein [Fulvivirga kasyanovii]